MKKEITLLINSDCLVFRTKELNANGLSNYEIAKLLEEGILEKIYQGVYVKGDIKEMKIVDINVIVENGIVSLTSAAFFYKLTDEQEGKITITLNRDQKPPKIPYDLFSYYYTTSKFYDIGLQVKDENGRKIKIYDIERTVCDILRHRNKYSNLLVREVIENYLAREDADLDKLISYSKELRIYNVLKQYLEILGSYDEKR